MFEPGNAGAAGPGGGTDNDGEAGVSANTLTL
jgi:hypothetical protein